MVRIFARAKLSMAGFFLLIRILLVVTMGGKIEKFEDLECWKSARQLMKMVMLLCQTEGLRWDFYICSQLKRAALSAMNNIAEGFGRHGEKEFIRFLDMAQSSAVEVKSMTYMLEDSGLLNAAEINAIRLKSDETKALTLGLIRYLRKRG